MQPSSPHLFVGRRLSRNQLVLCNVTECPIAIGLASNDGSLGYASQHELAKEHRLKQYDKNRGVMAGRTNR